MFSSPFYHAVTRKLTTVFGTLFNEIYIEMRDGDGNVVQTIQVPLSYGPKEKWLARLREESSIDNTVDGQTGVKMTIPRMSYEFTGLSYDATRQLKKSQNIIKCGEPKSEPFNATAGQTDFVVTAFTITDQTAVFVDDVLQESGTDYNLDIENNTIIFVNPMAGGEVVIARETTKPYQLMRVPYTFDFELNVLANKTEDGLKIIEQILPFFDQQLVVSVKMAPDVGVNEDIPFLLEGVTLSDNYDSGFEEQREIIWTLNFTARSYIYKPTQEAKIILFVEDPLNPGIGNQPSGDENDPNSKLVNLIIWDEDNEPSEGC